MQRSRSRNRYGGKTQFEILRDAAQAAALANGASLWYAGRQQDLSGFVFQDSAGTTPATGTDPIGLLVDRTGSFNASQATAANKPTLELQANGYYGMRFDGSSDLLNIAAGGVLQQTSSHFVTAAFTLDTAPTKQSIICISSTAATNPLVCHLEITTAGEIQVFWRDDAGVSRTITATVLSAGVPYVATAALIGTNRFLWLNGTQVGTNTSGALGTTTVNTANMGALVRGTASNFFDGTLSMVCSGQASIAASDRIAIERLGAIVNGAAYV